MLLVGFSEMRLKINSEVIVDIWLDGKGWKLTTRLLSKLTFEELEKEPFLGSLFVFASRLSKLNEIFW